LSKTDNLATLYWQRKGSTTPDKVSPHLLRLFGIHQRLHRYVPHHDYIPSGSNPLADDASRLFYLSDHEFLTHFNTVYPQPLSYHYAMLTPSLVSAVILVLLKKPYNVELLRDKMLAPTHTGDPGVISELNWASTPFSKPSRTRYRVLQVFHIRIGQTFSLLGHPDPRLNQVGKQDVCITRMLAAFSKKDPPPHRVKPVPNAVLRNMSATASTSNFPIQQAAADMIILAFCFLLRPGEYTTQVYQSGCSSFPFGECPTFHWADSSDRFADCHSSATLISNLVMFAVIGVLHLDDNQQANKGDQITN
jgi:hypothetical protein